MPAGLDPIGRRGCTRSRKQNEGLRQQLKSKPRERVRIPGRESGAPPDYRTRSFRVPVACN